MAMITNAPAGSHQRRSVLETLPKSANHGMNCWILYDESERLVHSEQYECDRLATAAARLGFHCEVVSTDRLNVLLSADDGPRLLRDGRQTSLPSLVLPRNGAHTTYREFTVLRHLEGQGVTCVNSSASIQVAADKFRAHALLAGSVPIPTTLMVDETTDLDLLDRELGFPVVAKLLAGTQGAGVMPLGTKSSLRDLRQMMAVAGRPANMLAQRLVGDSAGRDLRVLVVGGRAVACMLRTAAAGEVKANFSQGGSVGRHPITPQIAELAIRTCDLLGLRIAGVDLLFDGDGFRVCEANAAPGWRGLEACHAELDFAQLLLDYLASLVGIDPTEARVANGGPNEVAC